MKYTIELTPEQKSELWIAVNLQIAAAESKKQFYEKTGANSIGLKNAQKVIYNLEGIVKALDAAGWEWEEEAK